MKCHVDWSMKYRNILEALSSEACYTPACIAHFAEAENFLCNASDDSKRQEKNRIRIAMERLKNSHGFPKEGDLLICRNGFPPAPGWAGKRWQEAIRA